VICSAIAAANPFLAAISAMARSTAAARPACSRDFSASAWASAIAAFRFHRDGHGNSRSIALPVIARSRLTAAAPA